MQRLAGADTQIAAVAPAAGRAVVAGGDDLVVSYDDCAVLPAQARGPLENGIGYIQIIILLAGTGIHAVSLLFGSGAAFGADLPVTGIIRIRRDCVKPALCVRERKKREMCAENENSGTKKTTKNNCHKTIEISEKYVIITD